MCIWKAFYEERKAIEIRTQRINAVAKRIIANNGDKTQYLDINISIIKLMREDHEQILSFSCECVAFKCSEDIKNFLSFDKCKKNDYILILYSSL